MIQITQIAIGLMLLYIMRQQREILIAIRKCCKDQESEPGEASKLDIVLDDVKAK